MNYDLILKCYLLIVLCYIYVTMGINLLKILPCNNYHKEKSIGLIEIGLILLWPIILISGVKDE